MSIKQRIQKLEDAHGEGLVIYITDPFRADEDPVIRQAVVGGRILERKPSEEQGAFTRRANAGNAPFVYIESDAWQL
ncbi:MAG: hypothetical protein AB3N21_13795 [Ruegeria sp.]|uniref:hypothetical protein n=1 Tax=Ruegeria sp. TaxID=1879320 RepID=UPI00349EF567